MSLRRGTNDTIGDFASQGLQIPLGYYDNCKNFFCPSCDAPREWCTCLDNSSATSQNSSLGQTLKCGTIRIAHPEKLHSRKHKGPCEYCGSDIRIDCRCYLYCSECDEELEECECSEYVCKRRGCRVFMCQERQKLRGK